ncbi:armadillo-type protein [Pterulicium gracile]|uniref:Armadillo-type protein n=1 Tax=Pterulicium gracile TaxID=1884261 RepID=A0A5C3QQ33_9AGAR|nr:armadillo-type protein [Pterula gracilis]
MDPQISFQQLKAVCVPLLSQADLKPTVVPRASQGLSDLLNVLNTIQRSGPGALNSKLASYAFFPVSTILRHNTSDAIPNQIMVKLLQVLDMLTEPWWWDCEVAVWEQCIMLCGSIVGGIERKGKGKDRDDETKEAATRCLFTLLRERTPEERAQRTGLNAGLEKERLKLFVDHGKTPNLVPVLGQTLNALLEVTATNHRPLQLVALQVAALLLKLYAPKNIAPTVLPGVVSAMSKVALGMNTDKGWANGEIVEAALHVMQMVILEAISDKVCLAEGAIRKFDSLESLVNADPSPSSTSSSTKYSTIRTPAWLFGTSSQLHIALNNLSSLLNHTNTKALNALVKLSAAVLEATPFSLPRSQPLLLSFLLSLSNSSYPSVSTQAFTSLTLLLRPTSETRSSVLQTIITIIQDNLTALPLLIPTHSDSRVEHLANTIYAICRLVNDRPDAKTRAGLGKLFGPLGGIEKWGGSLLSALQFTIPTVTYAQADSFTKLLENERITEWAFPEITMKHIESHSARQALGNMLRALGKVAGDGCLFSVEWLISVGYQGPTSRSGAADCSLDSAVELDGGVKQRNPRLENIAELWDISYDFDDDEEPSIEYTKGLNVTSSSTPASSKPASKQTILHRCLSLHLLSITAGILQAQFPPLLLHTIYPVLHSIVFPSPLLQSTGMAALNHITLTSSYATPANLLLSNFDYALDAISRRLTRRWLDPEATKVLALLVRLVGKDVVDRAGDVVEECFDRLDDFHGYPVIVEGLMEVLREVVNAIEREPEEVRREGDEGLQGAEKKGLGGFEEWFRLRNELLEKDDTDYGPAPRKAWGPPKPDPNASPEDESEDSPAVTKDVDSEPTPTPTQSLTHQIVSRSLYFLTHPSPSIRALILSLLSSSVPVLPDPSLLPFIHKAWPFIINRLTDSEPYVISASASLIESFALHAGDFMSKRIWDDVWPRFQALLAKLDAADAASALARRDLGGVGTESAYTHSHRLYRAMMGTMRAAMSGKGRVRDESAWEVILAFRRFLHGCARELYVAIGRNNADAGDTGFLKQERWDVEGNVGVVMGLVDG